MALARDRRSRHSGKAGGPKFRARLKSAGGRYIHWDVSTSAKAAAESARCAFAEHAIVTEALVEEVVRPVRLLRWARKPLPPSPPSETHATRAEIAAATGFCAATIDSRSRRGDWPSVRYSRRRFFSIEGLPDWVREALVRHRDSAKAKGAA